MIRHYQRTVVFSLDLDSGDFKDVSEMDDYADERIEAAISEAAESIQDLRDGGEPDLPAIEHDDELHIRWD